FKSDHCRNQSKLLFCGSKLPRRSGRMRHSTLTASFVLILNLAANIGRAPAEPQGVPASRAAFHLLETTIEDIHAALQSKRITCRELVRLYMNRIEAYDKLGPRL